MSWHDRGQVHDRDMPEIPGCSYLCSIWELNPFGDWGMLSLGTNLFWKVYSVTAIYIVGGVRESWSAFHKSADNFFYNVIWYWYSVHIRFRSLLNNTCKVHTLMFSMISTGNMHSLRNMSNFGNILFYQKFWHRTSSSINNEMESLI